MEHLEGKCPCKEIASQEYRALGIATALSPQIDLATEPRWSRFNGTFGENPQLAADMSRAYVDGFQTSTGEKEISDGIDNVNNENVGNAYNKYLITDLLRGTI